MPQSHARPVSMQYDRQAFATAPDGTRLFYGVRGPRPDVLESGTAGPTWVLSDGIGCDGFAWRYLQPHLAERHRVRLADLADAPPARAQPAAEDVGREVALDVAH